MRNLLLLAPLVALAAVTLTAAPPQDSKQDSKPPAAAPNPNKTLVDRYCVGCHNQRLKTAKLELDTLDIAHPEKDPLTWERAIRKTARRHDAPAGSSPTHASGSQFA